jgi:error-prone DNA polymerase
MTHPPIPQVYAEFAVATCFSFLRGASHPEELLETALALGHAGMAVADRNSLAGVVRPFSRLKALARQAAEHNDLALAERLARFRYVVGVRLVFCDGAPDVLAYPKDREAYGRLCRLLTLGNLRAKKGQCRLELCDLLRGSSGLALVVVPPSRLDVERLRPMLQQIADARPGEVWLAAAMTYGPADARRLDALAEMAFVTGAPLLAINDVLYHVPERRPLHDVMTCIREHVVLTRAGRLLEANGERHLKPADEMARLFHDYPDALVQTGLLLQLCDFDLSQLQYEYPQETVPPGKTPQQHLEELTWKGAERRYPNGVPQEVQTTLASEFAFIAEKDYARYFLTVHDVVRFARDKGILCQGRGSAANSAVCYCLGVTAVDPSKIKLLFARFISSDRDEPPDIDVDFEHERREEVIQHIYERYGRERAAICATVIHYRPRSALREVGKVLGLSEDVTAALSGMVWGSWGGEPDVEHVRQTGLDPDNPLIGQALKLAGQLIEFPRHLSQHVGGFILTQRRLDETVPILNGAMKDRTFIEWDKDDIDALKIMKVDVLALGMLTCIKKAFSLLNRHAISHIEDMAQIEGDDDPAVYEMLSRGDSIGVFQVESRAQMNMLPRLRPAKFYDLVIEVAIVRPGPIQGDMVHPYLRRKQGLEDVKFEGPSIEHGPQNELEAVLGRTMGVPLFQEQAMQVAITAAHFTPSEADGLRRAMATFRNAGGMEVYKTKMVGGMIARGYPVEFAERCFKQIEGFGSYGFPESHAASFAKLVYVSAWLKRHHPGVFACALLNSQPMGFYAPAQIVRDAREHGVEVRPADVNDSDWDCTLEKTPTGGYALRLGLRQIDGMSETCARGLAAARGESGGYADFDALVRRSGLTRPQLQILAQADALRSIGLDRRAALWRVKGVAPPAAPAPLLDHLPDLEAQPGLPTMALSEHVVADYQTTRLSLKGHPMGFLRQGFAARAVIPCAQVATLRDGAKVATAGVVLVRQRPGTGVVCFITIEDETGVANLVVLPQVFERYRKVIMSARLIEVQGHIQRTEQAAEVVHVLAHRLIDRSPALRTLAEPQLDLKHLLAFGDEVVKNGPGGSRRPAAHPREVRVMPPSRDFH